MTTMPKPRPGLRVAVCLALLASLAGLTGTAARAPETKKRAATVRPTPAPKTTPAPSASWKDIDRLVSEQKLAEALAKVDAILASARSRRDDDEWTRALIRSVQLRTALHGYETAVRFLKDQPWPDGELSRAALDLFYAHALVSYSRAYSWEIAQRELVASDGPVDLKVWTRAQIVAEAERSDRDVWARRDALGRLPVGAFSEYMEPNDYPREIRGTLRDAVSYLFVQLLADNSFWTPAQLNAVSSLDLTALLSSAERDPAAALADPSAHPLRKIAAILGDLEAWHASLGERDAALEARLERLRRLHESFTAAPDRARIRAALEERLARDREIPWWAMGMAELAEFRKDEPVPDNLIRALATAREGSSAYPSSVGARRCEAIASAIEAPDYSVTAMSSDAPDRRSIEVTHRNLSNVYFRAYALDLEARLASATDYNLLPQGEEVRKLLATHAAAEWSAPLPATPDYKPHRTFVTPPMRAPGLYVVVASARPGFEQADNRVESLSVVVSDLVLLAHPDGGSLGARVVTGEGKPAAGADVFLYAYDWGQGRRHHRVEQQKAGADGQARFAFAPGRNERSYFLLARRGADYALDPSYVSLAPDSKREETAASMVYTDRSIYRPGQSILWKVVAYHGRAEIGRLETFPQAAVTLHLRDANNEIVQTAAVSTNAFGSAAGEFAIPPGRALGAWRIESSLPGAANVRVEEYKRPTFEVKWDEPKSAVRLNRDASLTGSAKYYFGLPVTSGSVRWTVTRVPQYPWWWFWMHPGGGGAQEVVAQGGSALKDDGTFEAKFLPKADEREPDARSIAYRYEAHADVTDEGGETRSDDRAFTVGLVSVRAEVDLGAGFLRESRTSAVTLRRTDLDGTPRAGAGRWRLLSIAQPDATPRPADLPPQQPAPDRFATPGDRLRPRWDTGFSVEQVLRGWKDGAEKAHGDATHDAKGEARVSLPALPAGAWRLRYETRDEFGAVYETSKDFLVAGPRMPVRLPGVLIAEQASVPAGGTARLLAFTGLPGQTYFLEILRDTRVVSTRTLDASSPALIELPVSEADRGGFSARLSLVSDHQLVQETQGVFVPWTDRELALSFATFRDLLRPGSKETWRVTVRAPEGSPAESRAAEVLAYMFDRSLDAFVPHTPPDLLSAYPNRTSPGFLRASLGAAAAQWLVGSGFGPRTATPPLRGDRLKFDEGYGIGGPGVRGRMMMKTASMEQAATAPASAAVDAATVAGVAERAAPGREDTRNSASISFPAPDAPSLRSDFSETAFWRPQLLTGPDGSASIEFQVPDSVTSWNVWVHALTRDLKAASLHREARTVKDLMVRPYVPRFLREGDAAELKVVVNNASERPLSGRVTLDILDAETNASALSAFGLTADSAAATFTAKPGAGADAVFRIAAPRRAGTYAFRVTASAGDLSDGELRPVPVLPGRMQLAQSRFAALRGGERRTLTFEDMAKGGDPTRVDEQLVVTVDAQLFYSVLNALPYLVEYPYECTEQTLNRFVSTGIVTSLFDAYPAVAKMAKDLSKRDTQLAPWAASDPNRKLALEETPWLAVARGGRNEALINVLDPAVAKAQRETSLARLRKAQTDSGGFPWWSGGPPSPYMTVYILYGLAKASEFGVDVPKDMVQRGWQYVAKRFRDDYAKRMAEDRCDFEWLTFVNYVASCYPDPSWMGDALTADERAAILRFTFRHWKEHSPYLKGYLSLTLKRAGRPQDARLVWASVMDSSKTDPDLGTYWAPEDRAWLWYNDTIETQASALRTLLELEPADSRRHGLVQWLFLHKKLDQWKSTRATAEVLYSLVWYLRKEGALSERETVTVKAGNRTTELAFEPDRYSGERNQVVVPGEKLDPARDSRVEVSKTGRGLAFASATWQFSTERLPAEDRGGFFSVVAVSLKSIPDSTGWKLVPLADGVAVAVGDEIEVQVSLRTKHAAEYVHLRDPRPAGAEPESVVSRWKWDLGIAWYEETRDSGSNFFFEQLPAGEYTFKYRIRANMAGTFRVGPATVQSMYAPEFNAYSAGNVMTIGAAATH